MGSCFSTSNSNQTSERTICSFADADNNKMIDKDVSVILQFFIDITEMK